MTVIVLPRSVHNDFRQFLRREAVSLDSLTTGYLWSRSYVGAMTHHCSQSVQSNVPVANSSVLAEQLLQRVDHDESTAAIRLFSVTFHRWEINLCPPLWVHDQDVEESLVDSTRGCWRNVFYAAFLPVSIDAKVRIALQQCTYTMCNDRA